VDSTSVAAIQNDPQFRELTRKRSRFAWLLTVLMLVIYLGFIFVVAFAPKELATPLGGITTVGMPVGLFVIFSAIALTGIYVRRANSEFDQLTSSIVKRAM
jgi:uncharacterized membrane protein (DUF485 family)